MAAATSAAVGHYVVLSIVGCDKLPDSGYMRAKVAQEKIIADSGLPFTIVRATQFHEFADTITASLTVDGVVRAPDGLIQPVAGADVAAEIAHVAQALPVDGIVNVGGTEKLTFVELAELALAHRGEHLPIVLDPSGSLFRRQGREHQPGDGRRCGAVQRAPGGLAGSALGTSLQVRVSLLARDENVFQYSPMAHDGPELTFDPDALRREVPRGARPSGSVRDGNGQYLEPSGGFAEFAGRPLGRSGSDREPLTTTSTSRSSAPASAGC